MVEVHRDIIGLEDQREGEVQHNSKPLIPHLPLLFALLLHARSVKELFGLYLGLLKI